MEFNVTSIIINTITQEFQEILDGDPDTYKGYGVVITNEQQFVKKIDAEHNKIYIVVKFLQGGKDFNQYRQPFTLNAISEHNSIKVCQQLMMDFAETYNLKFNTDIPDYSLRQIYTTVSSMNNFSEVYDGYRSIFYLSGTFFIGGQSNPISKISIELESGEEPEEIDFLSAQYSYDTQHDSQPFFGTNNFNRSVNKIATLSLGFTMYSTDTGFYQEVMDTIFNHSEEGEELVDINKTYKIHVSLKSGREYVVDMKLVSVSGSQELRDFPMSSFTFVR